VKAEEELVCGADATPDTPICPYTHRRQFKWGFVGDSICKGEEGVRPSTSKKETMIKDVRLL
jgi:hypothetical protein